jgi:broad specificity phosphatase PhoE
LAALKGGNLAKLLMVRHGETDRNSSQRYWGRTDVGLGPVGLRQAEQLRDRLAVEKIDCVYSSVMRRALVTAQTLASLHKLPVVGCPELREIDFGKIEGMNFGEVQNHFPEIALMWIKNNTELVYPEGEGLAQLEKRITEFRTRLCNHTEDQTILIVAHSGVLRSLICQLLDLDMKSRWHIRLDLASLSVVETYAGTTILSLLNDTSHLIDRCKL